MKVRDIQHALLPVLTPEERSRQRSVVALRRLLNEHVRPRNESLYEREGLPAFTARHGHAPRDAAEVNEALFASPGHRLWSALNRSAQELIWMATGGGAAAHRAATSKTVLAVGGAAAGLGALGALFLGVLLRS